MSKTVAACFLLMLFTAAQTFAQCGTVISTFPYQEDFEINDGSWIPGGTLSDWAWGAPAKPLLSAAGSGNYCWMTGGLSLSFYNFGERSYLVSPCFNFSSLSNPMIRFKIFWESEYTWDGTTFQYSLNGGNSWTNAGAFGDTGCLSKNWFNYTPVHNLNNIATVRDGWTGTVIPTFGNCFGDSGSGGWLDAVKVMPFLAWEPNVHFRFVFGAGTNCNGYDGFAFDNIIIDEAPQPITITHVLQPASCDMDDGTATLTVSGGTPPYTYNWQPPVSTASYASGLAIGDYTIIVTDSFGCDKLHTLSIEQVQAFTLSVSTSADTCYRNTGSVTVSVNGGTAPFSYIWTGAGDTTSAITNLAAGNYSVLVTDSKGCTETADAVVENTGQFTINLGSDTSFCINAAFLLSPGNFEHYLWQDGNTQPAFNVTNQGFYWVEVTNAAGCTAADSIRIVEDCIHDVMLPNAFTPNGDQTNDVFMAKSVSVNDFSLMVFSRWGEKLFESNSIAHGWNGTFKGTDCQQGVYLWVMEYKTGSGSKKEKTGNVSLIR